MGYAIRLKDLDYSDLPHTNGGDINTTYNLATMFEALPCKAPSKWNHKQAGIIAPKVAQSLRKLNDRPHDYDKYNAPNGWGTVHGAKIFLAECLIIFSTYPDKIIEVE